LTPSPTATATLASPTPVPATATSTAGIPSPTLTTTPASPTASLTITPTAQLAIQSINPIGAQANTTVIITITGSGFQNGAIVTFEGVQGLPQEVTAVQVQNSSTILVTVNARNDGSSGTQVWDVRITNPDQSTAVLLDAFTVTPG
jgi:hypothetical protein